MLMCTHFRSYLRGAQFTLRTDHSYLRWLQRFRNEDGMLARWYLLLGQFSVTFEYRPGAQHANADGMTRQCGPCQRPDCPVSAMDLPVSDAELSRRWVSLWTQTYCRSCPAKLSVGPPGGVLRRIYSRRGPTWTVLLHLARMRRWRRCASGFSRNLFRCGWSVQDFLRSYAVGGYKWATCPSTRMGVYGDAEHRRRLALNWWFLRVSGGV